MLFSRASSCFFPSKGGAAEDKFILIWENRSNRLSELKVRLGVDTHTRSSQHNNNLFPSLVVVVADDVVVFMEPSAVTLLHYSMFRPHLEPELHSSGNLLLCSIVEKNKLKQQQQQRKSISVVSEMRIIMKRLRYRK